MSTTKRPAGITPIHRKGCPVKGWEPCRCGRSYRAEAYDNASGRRRYRSFPTLAAAKNWRTDMQVKLKLGTERASEPVTVQQAWEEWYAKAQAGVIRGRGGAAYKPSVLNSYRLAFDGRLLERFGATKLGDLRRRTLQDYIDGLVPTLAPQTIRNLVTALRVLLRWAIRQELLAINPAVDLELPSGGTRRERIATPAEALELVTVLPTMQDRALWATAFFAGLRRGELMALRWDCVDLVARTITVDPEHGSYDPRTQTFGAPKSQKGARTLGLAAVLLPFLTSLDGAGDELVFPSTNGTPFVPRNTLVRARKAWAVAGLQPIGFHDARHTYASYLIAAQAKVGRFDAKAVQEAMGHSSIQVTYDRYGKLFPGSSDETTRLLDSYLDDELDR